MKTTTIVGAALLLIIGSACPTHAQVVTLGGATFDATSDQVPTFSYSAVTTDAVKIYTGYGDKAGFTRTEVYHRYESVAGVKALKRSTMVGSPPPSAGAGAPKATPAAPAEDWWLAMDTQGNLRVLKVVTAGLMSFQASATNAPPILMPASIAAGQTWSVLDKTITVEALNASAGDYTELLKLKIETSPVEVQYEYYLAGTGRVITQQGRSLDPSGSGWELKRP